MKIAIFADLHGRILLSFILCARWEQETQQKIDLILQAGDLGAFPDENTLDKATRRYALEDPTELGFLTHFTTFQQEVANQLQHTTCPLIFVRGNHEDHLWLDALEKQASEPIFSIDAYKRIWCLRSGMPYTFRSGDEAITLLGAGRVGAPRGQEKSLRPKYIQEYERERFYKLAADCEIDVVLSHDSPPDYMFPDSGIEEIGMVLDQYKPGYHFFGHYGGPCHIQRHSNTVTTLCKLADLHWSRSTSGKILERGAMGILSWHDRTQHSFKLVDEPWLKEYSAFTYSNILNGSQ